MGALGRDVLGKFGYEVQGAEDLEIPLRPGGDSVASGVGKSSARLLFGFQDNLSGVGHLDDTRQAERATGDVLDQPLDANLISGGQVNRLVDAETGMLPGLHILDDIRFDFAFVQIQVKDRLLPDE